MNQRIKVGNVYVELRDGGGTAFDLTAGGRPLKAEKPDTPEPLEEPQYIYRPNDPFQSSIDEARAIASIQSSHRPWVKKTWFVLFVLGPLVCGELFALALTGRTPGEDGWMAFFSANAIVLPVWLVYFSIWRRKAKR